MKAQLVEPRAELDAPGGAHVAPRSDLRSIAGIRSSRSLGVARYVDHLAQSLTELGVDYRPAARPLRGRRAHLHLANSSRSVLWYAAGARTPFVVTIHDVLPRTHALTPWYRSVVYPLLSGAVATIVHSEFAARQLLRLGAQPRRLEVIPHPAPSLPSLDQGAARHRLGWNDEPPLFVVPGVLKPAKLVDETLAAAAPLLERGRLQLALVGPVRDETLAHRARALGALVLPAPDRDLYETAIVAADCVLVLRDASVGETNGPLMDALGAGRAVLATATGSIPEIAGDAALYRPATVDGIREGLEALCARDQRVQRAEIARARGEAFSPDSIARAHMHLFSEVLDG